MWADRPWQGGILSVDDTVLDRPYSQKSKTEPVNYRVVDKAEGKTKNDLFRGWSRKF